MRCCTACIGLQLLHAVSSLASTDTADAALSTAKCGSSKDRTTSTTAAHTGLHSWSAQLLAAEPPVFCTWLVGGSRAAVAFDAEYYIADHKSSLLQLQRETEPILCMPVQRLL
jgi:hypothetical protein